MRLREIEFQPLAAGREGWYVGNGDDLQIVDSIKYCRVARDLAPDAAALGCHVFCGLRDGDDSPLLFLVACDDPCQLVREFRVGSHNAGSAAAEEREIDAVYDQMQAVRRIRPFRPYYIDAAGYHATFEGPLTEAEAFAIAHLLKVGLEWYAQTEECDVPGDLLRENEIHLWWD